MNLYSQIVNLKNNTLPDSERGYKFEALIREIQPWDERPPIVMSPKSEQLDGVFIYKSIIFIIESKAVKKKITPGCKEWEDYELKLHKRKGNVIGLFCSLFDVSPEISNAANSLNQQGIYNIVLSGSIWECLNEDGFEFGNLLDFMILNAKVKFIATIENLKSAKKWYYESELIENYFNDLCKKKSSVFIRRFTHKFHDKIYVDRHIDNKIESHIKLFKPSNLRKSKKENLSQVIILRDLSGSGKTTLSIENIKNSNQCLCFGTTANNTEIDLFLDNLLNEIKYPKIGIKELIAIDKPFLFIIDSLDEVPINIHPQKRREIKSLFSKINELNNEVISEKFTRFPIVILFTVREDYWRDWDSSFDGREIVTFKNRISIYLEDEFKKAIKKYSEAYNYEIQNRLNEDSKSILSIPVNLEIFSEVNEYNGAINVVDVWEGKMLAEFFKKKYDNIINRHWIMNFSEEIFIEMLSLISYNIIKNKSLFINKKEIKDLFELKFPQHLTYLNEILKLFVSELILIEDAVPNHTYRFKYTRFIEYLVSLLIVEKVNNENSLPNLDKFIQEIFDSQVVDIYSVLKNIKNICKIKYPELESEITEYYQKSLIYLRNFLPKLRGDISQGKVTNKNDINQLIGNTYFQDANMYWDMFFIIAAKKNKQSKNIIISSFNATWEANKEGENRYKRWKLVDKLSSRGFLLDERVINILFNDSESKDWEEYLGHILESKLQEEFFELWHQIGGQSIIKKNIVKDKKEWVYVEKLLEIIVDRKKYVLGDILLETEEVDNEYLVFDKKRVIINGVLKSRIDRYIDSWVLLFNNDKFQLDFLPRNELSDKEIEYINEQFDEKLIKNKGNISLFLKNLIKNNEKHSNFINSIINNKILKFDIDNKSNEEITLLMDISETTFNSLFYLNSFLIFIFENGYKKNSLDDNYFSMSQVEKKDSYYLTKAFYMVNDKFLIHDIHNIEKIIYTIESFKNKRVIGYKFPKLIQIANNAVEHYQDHLNLILKAMQIFGVYDELIEIKSFSKKIENIKQIEQNHKYDELLKLIFPKLF